LILKQCHQAVKRALDQQANLKKRQMTNKSVKKHIFDEEKEVNQDDSLVNTDGKYISRNISQPHYSHSDKQIKSHSATRFGKSIINS